MGIKKDAKLLVGGLKDLQELMVSVPLVMDLLDKRISFLEQHLGVKYEEDL